MKYLHNEKGNMIVLVALAFVVICAFAGYALDTGMAFFQKGKLQNAVDAAALAGAAYLPDTSQAQSKAMAYAALNGVNSSDITVHFSNNIITVTATTANPTFFMKVLNINSLDIKATASATKGLAPCFDYTLFSGSKNDTLSFNGNDLTVKGSSHANQKFSVNGNYITITGACEAMSTVSSNGNHISIPYRYPNSAYVSMPDYTVQVQQEAQAAGQVYNTSQTYNGNNINVANSIYVKGNATINGNTITGAGAILATGSISINGNCINATTNDQVCLYSNSDISINGNNIRVDGILYAPNGTISFNGNNITVNGKVIGNKVTFNGNTITINGIQDAPSLPNAGVKLIA